VLGDHCSRTQLEARTESMKNGVVLGRFIVDDINGFGTAINNHTVAPMRLERALGQFFEL